MQSVLKLYIMKHVKILISHCILNYKDDYIKSFDMQNILKSQIYASWTCISQEVSVFENQYI